MSDQSLPQGSHIISTVLSPAIKLWLRSQVQQADELQVTIAGGDRQLLSGYIPSVVLAAHHVIYQNLHLSHMRVTGENIRVNFGQVLRGKPLRLQEIVPVTVNLQLEEADVNASLRSDLLSGGVADLLTQLFQAQHSLPLPEIPTSAQAVQLRQSRIRVAPGRITLQAEVAITDHTPITIVLQSGIEVVHGRKLCLINPCLLEDINADEGATIAELDGFCIDLGAEVNIQALFLGENCLTCHGQINVVP